ncbi:hypothetical protein TcCL_ESM06934 [Trypanosoma cruzi]|nr:hypothetical protein TcCL_ESM06934 [Trypanosoma cruzi]
MRLFRPRVKLGVSIPRARDGIGVVRAQALPFREDEPSMDPQLPGRARTMGRSDRVSKFGTWGARRFATCPVRLESAQGFGGGSRNPCASLSLRRPRLTSHPTSRFHQ